MNNNRSLNLNNSVSNFALIAAISICIIHGSSIANAETLYYDQTSNSVTLGTVDYNPNSLAPSGSSDNTIYIDYQNGSKTDPFYVYGGIADNNASADNNNVFLINGTATSVYGGYYSYGVSYSEVSGASNNTVILSNDSLAYDVAGSFAFLSNPDTIFYNNKVILNDNASVSNGVYGAYFRSYETNKYIVNGNTVELNDNSSVKKVDDDPFSNPNVYGGYSNIFAGDIQIINNKVVMSGTSFVEGDVYGGGNNGVVARIRSKSDEKNIDSNINDIVISNNKVILQDNSKVNSNIYGGHSISVSNVEGAGNKFVQDNIVTINGSSYIGDSVYGGYINDQWSKPSDSLDDYNSGINFNANQNIVVISDSSYINGNVVGGYIEQLNSYYDGSTSSASLIEETSLNYYKAINNNVTLIGENITINGSLFGGYYREGDYITNKDETIYNSDIPIINPASNVDVFTGNTLNLVRYRGTVSGIYNFENFNWTLPGNVVNGDTLVTIADGGIAVDLTNTKHTIADMQVTDNRLHAGDEVTFISKTQGNFIAKDYTIKQGQFIVYDATLSQKANNDTQSLVLTIAGTGNGGAGDGQSAAKVNPKSKVYSEGRAAALGLLNQANELISTAGIDKVRVMVRSNEDKVNRPAFIPFLLTRGAYQSYQTGSHVDIKSFDLAAGFATGFEFASGYRATVGAFFEYGRGSYNTYNQFAGFSAVHGDGNSTYKGGGILARVDFAGTGLGRVNQLAPYQADGFYAEASLRAGRISNTFDAGRHAGIYGDMNDMYGGSYDSKVSYYGGHLAGGYVFNFDEKQSLDAYGRYLWTYMDGDDVTIMNEKLRFDRSNSSRIQIGTRYSYDYSDQFKPYVGAAYEYEFDGEIKARAYEFNLGRPSLQGSTGIFEVGFSFRPIVKNKSLNIDVNGQAYTGQRQGGGGGVKVNYQF